MSLSLFYFQNAKTYLKICITKFVVFIASNMFKWFVQNTAHLQIQIYHTIYLNRSNIISILHLKIQQSVTIKIKFWTEYRFTDFLVDSPGASILTDICGIFYDTEVIFTVKCYYITWDVIRFLR